MPVRALRIAALVTLVALVPTNGAGLSAQSCPTEPTYDPGITSPSTHIPTFPDVEATTAQINTYFQLIDSQTDRVTTDSFATSYNGTPMLYSFVGTPTNVASVDQIAADNKRLRDPRATSPAEAAALAANTPALAWYSGNIHGGETSGADAAIQILYELAARTDCQVEDILGNLVVGIIPTQNPDGRDAGTRQNTYTFDLNRDWFALSQAEMRGKLELLTAYPPIVYVDAHEMGGTSFFFPPNADPIYHEISDESLHWIKDIYGEPLGVEFTARGFDYFTRGTYDLLYIGYGSTVPTTAYTAAGMTFEKGSADNARQRWLEQFTAGWFTINQASANKVDILNQLYAASGTAIQEGADGFLEPNAVYNPGNEVIRHVPNMAVRHYFLPGDRSYSYVARMVDRLLTFGVEVYQLTSDVQVNDLHSYGRAAAPGVVKRGSYWIPMNQPQKRWIQAVMHEDPYVPFPYFYDVTAWSNPLLLNVGASFAGDALTSVPALRVTRAPAGGVGTSFRPGSIPPFYWFPGDTGMAVAGALALERAGVQVRRTQSSTQVGATTIPSGAFVIPAAVGILNTIRNVSREFVLRVNATIGAPPAGIELTHPKVAVYQGSGETFGHLRWLLEQSWKVPYDLISGPQAATAALSSGEYDVFVVGGASTTNLTPAQLLVDQWIQAGGIYVGTTRPGNTGGTPFAISAGWTSSTATAVSGLQIPGTLFRVGQDDPSPVTLGSADPYAYWYQLGERRLSLSTTGSNALVFPSSEPDFFTSGYAEGHQALKGSAALVDEARGQGRVILFSGEPNFRAYTEGSSFFLANSLIYPLGAAPQTVNTASAAAASDVAAAMASAEPEYGPGRPIRIEVPAAQSTQALAVLRGFTAQVRAEEARGSAFFEIPNPEGLDPKDHPFSRELLPALKAAGVAVRSAIL